MSKELIFESLAFLEGYNPSPSMKGMKNSNQVHDVYIKNAVISLTSIKEHNPETDVGIVINFQLSEEWKNEFESKGIIVWEQPFEEFHMPQSIVYSLSYYKLCAFRFLVKNTDYEKFCFIDCDTFAVSNFAPVWEECEDAFLMVPADEAMDHETRNEISLLHRELGGRKRNVAHISSGFIISTRTDAEKVLDKCASVYKRLMEIDAKPSGGDEVIWSLALADMDIGIYSPKAYCLLSNVGFREYWVDKSDYRDKNIVMWHLPAEKRYAMIWAYDYFKKHNRLPSIEKMARACRIRKIRNRFNFVSVQAIMKDSTAVSRNVKKIFGK